MTEHQLALIKSAKYYAEKYNWKVIPLHSKHILGHCTCRKKASCHKPAKHPRIKGWQQKATTKVSTIKEWWSEWPDANIGIVTGKKSGLTVVDVDDPSQLKALGLPNTIISHTSKGLHYLYAYYKGIANEVNIKKKKLDIRNDDGYFIAPPSIHFSGAAYKWDEKSHPDKIDKTKFPSELFGPKKLGENEGRNSLVFKEACKLRARGYNDGAISEAVFRLNEERCDPQLDNAECEHIIKNVCNYPQGNSTEEEKEETQETPAGLADFYLHHKKVRLKYWRDQYYYWADGHYNVISDSQLRCSINAFLMADTGLRKYAGKNKVREMMQCLQTGYVNEKTEPFVKYRHLMPFRNGVYNFNTKSLEKHDPSRFVTYVVPYNYEDSPTPNYSKVALQILGDKLEVWEEIMGLHLFQPEKLEKFFLLYGTGMNGKTVLLTILQCMLGEENCSSIPLESFHSQSFLLNETYGKLANIIPELPYIDKANEGIIKAYATKELMTFNRKFKAAFNARPTALLTMATNTLPPFQDKTDGIWRRMVLINLHKQFQKKDRRLIDPNFWNLSGELGGIMTKAMAGIERIKERGELGFTQEMMNDVEEYRTGVNSIAQFVEEHCKFGESNETIRRVYDRFKLSAVSNGYKPMGIFNFMRTLKEEAWRQFQVRLEVKPVRSDVGVHKSIVGIKLLDVIPS